VVNAVSLHVERGTETFQALATGTDHSNRVMAPPF
jgi:hypothetical protein